jgi:anti-anti-sigma regulatory factor
MATIPSLLMSIAAGESPDRVIVTVYGGLGVSDVAHLQDILDGLRHDNDAVAITVDLHQVWGDTSGISGLVAAAAGTAQRDGQLTLSYPTEGLRQALESEGLTGLIGMLQRDRRPPWSVRARARQERRNHPSGQLPVVATTVLGSADNA